MTSRIDIIAPASITLLGSEIVSPDPAALTIIDTTTNNIALTIIAGDEAAQLSASGVGGATIASDANTLVITGAIAQVNAALASLQLSDPGADVISLTVNDPALAPAVTDIAVSVIPAAGPAFVAPPPSLTISPYSITTIAGLVLADPAASALAAAGYGSSETLAITLSVASGVLFLPALSGVSGIVAAGVGTGEVTLQFTADQLAAVNALLATLQWAGPAAISGLAFSARDVSGPLGATVTSGNIILDIAGTAGPLVSLTTGADGAILGVSNFSLGSRLNVTSIIADIGGINGQGAVFIAPGAALEVPYNLLALGGTSDSFGDLRAASLNETGALIAADGANISGPINLGGVAEIDFTGSLIAGSADSLAGIADISLPAGALITGSGDLVAGNFSESGLIMGAGTILAGGGDTLVLAAGEITGTTLAVAAGGVLVLGPISPLYGVFETTPLTVAAGTSLEFLGDSGAESIIGGFADTLDQTGGAIVITSPELFAGTIVNFAPGDRLIFPGLSGMSLLDITANSFEIAGQNSEGVTQLYTINASYPSGTALFVGQDAQGDGEVSLRDVTADVFINGATANLAALVAPPGVAQPLIGFDVLARGWAGQSLTVTISVSHGILSGPGLASGTQVTITAGNPTALNGDLQALSYTANIGASNDLLTITSASAVLSGLDDLIPIIISNNSGATVGYFGDAAQLALFSDSNAVPVTGAAAPGELIVTGSRIFDNVLDISGIGGTGLLVDGGGTAVFDSGAVLNVAGNMVVGDAGGSGLLAVLTSQASVAGNILLAGTLIDQGDIAITGGLDVSSGQAVFADGLSANAASIAAAGVITANGTSTLTFNTLQDTGTLDIFGAAQAASASLTVTGLLQLGGTARFVSASPLQTSGKITVGPDASLLTPGISQTGGVIDLAGFTSLAGTFLTDATLTMAGGTLLAPSLILQAGALVQGSGVIGAAGSLGSLLASGATILAQGDLALADNISLAAAAAVELTAYATLDIAHAVTGGTIAFNGGSALLTLNDPAVFNASVTGMVASDAIDLIGIAPSLVSVSAGQVSANAHAFALTVAAGQPALSVLADGAGGALITLGGDLPCFARGTRLLTPNGYRPVETFRPGDPVITLQGARRGVRWIGRRTLDLHGYDKAQPVMFAAGALAPGVPNRPVLLSPLHAVFIGGVLVPACHLVNGATITAQHAPAVTYYHIELDRHEVLLADGMPAESYLDTGNRGALYDEIGRRGRAGEPFAPLVTRGPALARIRRGLHEIALAAGFNLTYRPALRGIAGARAVVPKQGWRRGRRLTTFDLGPGCRSLTLVGPTAAPADTDPDSEDRRRLAICLAGIPSGSVLADGWLPRAADDAGIWMAESARLDFSAAGRHKLTLELAAVIRSWVPPAPTIMPPIAPSITPPITTGAVDFTAAGS